MKQQNLENELVVQDISLKEGGEGLLYNVNLSVRSGGSISLLGPSGCGKTTLLRIIAGLERADSGKIIFRGRDLADVPPHLRNFGMMFQDYALFPHRNVFKNIAFGLEIRGFSAKEIDNRVAEMLELVNLERYSGRDVKELSGGERQRVALARTLAPSPDLIMLDEPLGALDRRLRERLLFDLCSILEKTSITTIWVTHDHNEAFAASDLVCVMHSGRILQIDSPQNLYNSPVDSTVADFLGFQNIMKIRDGREILIMPDSAIVLTEGKPDSICLPASPSLMSPHDSSVITILGEVVSSQFQGATRRISVRVKKSYNFEFSDICGMILSFDIRGVSTEIYSGDELFFRIDPAGIRTLKIGEAMNLSDY